MRLLRGCKGRRGAHDGAGDWFQEARECTRDIVG